MMEDMGLDKKTSWKGYAAHHIIPSKFKNHPVIKRLNLDLNNATNGIFLRKPGSGVSAMSRHGGGHGLYNEFVELQLSKIDLNQSDEKILSQFNELQGNLKTLLQNGLPMYKKNKGLTNGGATLELWTRFYNRLV